MTKLISLGRVTSGREWGSRNTYIQILSVQARTLVFDWLEITMEDDVKNLTSDLVHQGGGMLYMLSCCIGRLRTDCLVE